MQKSLKQLAEEYGLSRQGMRKRINKLPSTCYRMQNGALLVDEEGQRLLADIENGTTTIQPPAPDAQEVRARSLEVQIAALESSIADKDARIAAQDERIEADQSEKKHLHEQIAVKDEQIGRLSELLTREQALAANTAKLLADAQTQIAKLTEKPNACADDATEVHAEEVAPDTATDAETGARIDSNAEDEQTPVENSNGLNRAKIGFFERVRFIFTGK